MEMKWFAIMFIGIITAISAGGAVSDYSKNQCRVEAIKTIKDPAAIKDICK